jgi:hypothetical protein
VLEGDNFAGQGAKLFYERTATGEGDGDGEFLVIYVFDLGAEKVARSTDVCVGYEVQNFNHFLAPFDVFGVVF